MVKMDKKSLLELIYFAGGNENTIKEKYKNDPEFYAVVNILINLILNYEKRVETEIRKANNMANVSTGL